MGNNGAGTRPRSLLGLLVRGVLPLLLAAPAAAQGRAELDLKPADFPPDEVVALRVDDLGPGSSSGTAVAVTVANRTRKPVTARVECSLFDEEREDLGIATAETPAIPAGERAAVTVTAPAEGARRAYCRIAGVR